MIIVADLKVLLDNQTRWNSQYLSISQALKLKERLVIFQDRYAKDLADDALTYDDWSQLQQLKDGLYPFLEITNRIQESQASLWQWLPAVEALYNHLERELTRYKEANDLDNPLAVCTQAGWEKLRAYYNDTDKAHHLYAAATLFNPEQRMSYFNRNWSGTFDKHKKAMLTRVRKEWERSYKPQSTSTSTPTAAPPSIFDLQLGYEPHHDTKDPLSEYALSAPVKLQATTTQHMLQWWDHDGHPQLKQMAFNLLAIPATSCDLERVFSGAGNLIDAAMNRMNDDTIEKRQCLNLWLKNNLYEIQIK